MSQSSDLSLDEEFYGIYSQDNDTCPSSLESQDYNLSHSQNASLPHQCTSSVRATTTPKRIWSKQETDTSVGITTPNSEKTIQHDKVLSVGDVPQCNKRPEYGLQYRSFLDNNTFIQYDHGHRCFKNTAKVACNITDDWCLVQIKVHTIEPWMSFEKLGFEFQTGEVSEEILALEQICTTLQQDQQDYMMIKIKSIKALHYICSSRLIEANRLLNELETDVVLMENCDLTAWFYLAQFWLLVKEMNGMRYDGTIRNHYKTQCLSHLQKSRSCLVAAGHKYRAAAAVILWWSALTHADLTHLFMNVADKSIATTQPSQHLSKLEPFEKNLANDFLHQFCDEVKNIENFPESTPELEPLKLLLRKPTIEEARKTTTCLEGCSKKEDGDVVFLNHLYYDFIKQIKGKEPECIQQITRNKKDGKIYIFTTDDESRELLECLAAYNADTTYFAVRKGAEVEMFHPVSEGQCKSMVSNIVRERVSPGSVLYALPTEYCQTHDVPSHIGELPKLEDLEILEMGTLGCLVTDTESKNKENKHILTAGHTFNTKIKANISTSFFSAYLKENSRVLQNVNSSKFLGYFGKFANKSCPSAYDVLIDALLVDVDDNFVRRPWVNMTFDWKGKPIEMYTENVDDLNGMKVSMYGCISGECVGQGTIVVTNVEGLKIPGIGYVSGLLAIELDTKHRNAIRQRLAQKGDSGAVIFGFHEKKKKCYAIGLVFGQNITTCINSETGENFPCVTLCTALVHAKQYFCDNHGKNIEVYFAKGTKDENEGAVGFNKQVLNIDTVEGKELTHSDSGYATFSPDCFDNLSDSSEQSNRVRLSFAAVSEHNQKQKQEAARHDKHRSWSICSTDSRFSLEGKIVKRSLKETNTHQLHNETMKTEAPIPPACISRLLSQNSLELGYSSGYEGCCDSDVDDKSNRSEVKSDHGTVKLLTQNVACTAKSNKDKPISSDERAVSNSETEEAGQIHVSRCTPNLNSEESRGLNTSSVRDYGTYNQSGTLSQITKPLISMREKYDMTQNAPKTHLDNKETKNKNLRGIAKDTFYKTDLKYDSTFPSKPDRGSIRKSLIPRMLNEKATETRATRRQTKKEGGHGQDNNQSTDDEHEYTRQNKTREKQTSFTDDLFVVDIPPSCMQRLPDPVIDESAYNSDTSSIMRFTDDSSPEGCHSPSSIN